MLPILSAISSDIAAEIGDKSQILIMLLALRFRRPVPIILGMTVATFLTHALAGAGGIWIFHSVPRDVTRLAVGLLFVAVGLWSIFPREMEQFRVVNGGSAFVTAIFSYFFAETGGKTYVVTAALSAETGSWMAVVISTAIGEVLTNAPLIILGDRLMQRLNRAQIELKWISRVAGALLVATGIAQLAGMPIF
jgi:putative Ca2+/H+ antiporter (TMEM165/GDT1 family)